MVFAVLPARVPGIHPFFETLTNGRIFYAPRPINSPDESQTLLTAARVPAVRGFVAVNILRLSVTIRRPQINNHTVLDEGLQETVMGVVGRAEEREPAVVTRHVAVNFLPTSSGIIVQRVVDGDNGFQEGEEGFCRHERRRPRTRVPEKFPAVYFLFK